MITVLGTRKLSTNQTLSHHDLLILGHSTQKAPQFNIKASHFTPLKLKFTRK
jgi:hypothetical protein